MNLKTSPHLIGQSDQKIWPRVQRKYTQAGQHCGCVTGVSDITGAGGAAVHDGVGWKKSVMTLPHIPCLWDHTLAAG